MGEQAVGSAYPAKLKVDSWQIVIPTRTKISPICFNSDFRSQAEAEAWMDSTQGRSLLATAQRTGHMSVQSTDIVGDDPMNVQEIPNPEGPYGSKIVQRSSIRFPPETWERDRVERFQIEPLIQLFHRSVPTLRFLNWTIEEIERGYAVRQATYQSSCRSRGKRCETRSRRSSARPGPIGRASSPP
jgi:hypothetical protein